MSDSVRESILANIETTLNGLTVLAGYNYGVAYVDREYKHWDELSASQFPALFVLDGGEKLEPETGHYVMSEFSPLIVGYIRLDKTPSEDINKYIQDVRKIMMVDLTRGGYATLTHITDIFVPKPVMKPYGYFEMSLIVKYRYDFTNP